MAFDGFLKLGDGTAARGDATDAKHPREIILLSFAVSASNPTAGGATTGPGDGRGQVSTFKITKPVDAASPVLFQTCCAGTSFPTATVTVRRAGGAAPLEFLVYTFTKVYVSKVTTACPVLGGDHMPVEEVELSFASIHQKYVPQRPDGAGGSPIEGGWDVALNMPK